MKIAAGRFPLADGPSTARFWTGPEGVPRPDKTLWWLRLLATVGLDHFYLRSPVTGFFKFVTVLVTIGLAASGTQAAIGAVFFGLWWLWDNLQLWTEKERVLTYGMSLPFDAATGIGQGMIVEDPPFNPVKGKQAGTYYEQKSNFSLWAFGSLFSFLGVDSIITGKWAQLIRKWVDLAAFCGFLYGISTASEHGTSTFGIIVMILCALIFGAFVWIPWGLSLFSMNERGANLSENMDAFLNYFKSWVPSDLQPTVVQDFGYGAMSKAEFNERFKIQRAGDLRDSSAASGSVTWPASLLMGNVVTGPFSLLAPWFQEFFAARKAVRELSVATAKEELKKQAASITAANIAAAAGVDVSKVSDMVEEMQPLRQRGGARNLSNDSKIIGAVLIALLGGGALKATIDALT
jgi:hypothetical protein